MRIDSISLFTTIIFFSFMLFSQDPYNGYTLFTPITEGPFGGGENYTRLITNNGQTINQWNHQSCAATAAYLDSDGSLICPIKVENPFMVGAAYGGKIIKYNWSGEIIWEYIYADTNHLQHHDIEPMSNGNILLLSWDRKTYLEALDAGREDIESEMWPDKIVELQPIGYSDANIIWEWSFWDHLIQDHDSTLSNFGIIADHPELVDINLVSLDLAPLGYCDWSHSNSIDYNEELDQILISCRNLHEIYIIDHSTTTEEAAGHTGGISGMGGDILYRWGNPMNYGRGEQEDRMLIGQHDANWISSDYPGEDNILIYNNGSITSFGQDFTQSSVVQIEPPLNEFGLYDIDEVHSFAPLHYSWEYTGDFFSHIMSGVRRLENGNSIVTAATEKRIFEVTSDGDILWDYIHDEAGQNSISKAFKYPLDYMHTGEFLFGDINYDDNTDIFDIIMMINHILEINELELSQLYVSDINYDGIISVQDIILLVAIILE